MLQRISRRFNIAPLTLRDRLVFLGYRSPSASLGYAAIEAWERDMNVMIKILGAPGKLRLAISRRAYRVREEIRRQQERTVTIMEAARMLRIPSKLMRSYCDDLLLIERDHQGRIPLRELRRFFAETGWWLVKNYRYLKKTGEIGGMIGGRAGAYEVRHGSDREDSAGGAGADAGESACEAGANTGGDL